MWWPAREAAINRAATFLKAAFHGKPLESRGMIRRTDHSQSALHAANH